MKKFFWIALVATLFCWDVSRAQRPSEIADSAAGLQLDASGGKSAVFVNFSGLVKEYNKVWLQWNVDSVEEGDYFIIERATDGGQYETISVIRNTGNNNHYELTDIAPPNGADSYRIKYTSQDGKIFYSKAIQVSLSGAVSFKFYPNPVDKLFIIRTEHVVEIQVIDATGFARLSKHLQPGIQVINVSSLEQGVYILRVADKESNRITSNQLLKN
ncbi:MAG TPA: T9SS type A sorting domain-containing protein [Puia sp.]|nr:T9SS type A sorting domain-containing protein [Puia sp.]